jgi:hypothetical protein
VARDRHIVLPALLPPISEADAKVTKEYLTKNYGS